ncbi:cholesterol oxidase, partial [Nocardia farcinica]|nr:cholesterol oxidase [Nocardia farcinica]
NAFALMATVLVSGDMPRVRRWLRALWRARRDLARAYSPRHWSEQTIGLLVMQSVDNSITTYTARGWFGRRRMTTKQGAGEPNPTWLPSGHEV